MHDVQALIAKCDKLAARARQFENAIVCQLVQGFSLVPITDALAKQLAAYQPETKAALTSSPLPTAVGRWKIWRRLLTWESHPNRATSVLTQPKPYLLISPPGRSECSAELADGLQALAIELSQDCPVAYVTTFYFGGQGGQNALVWDKGRLRFSPATRGYNQGWPNSPISQALRMIGVVAERGMDEFDTLGLGKHRETHQWAASVK